VSDVSLSRLCRSAPAARYALGGIRILNGGLALVAPELIVKRLEGEPLSSAAATYGLRLFGVRTVFLGIDLLTMRGHHLKRSLGHAVLIHASDTATAATLGVSGRIRPRVAVPLTAISALNTVLAVVAWRAAGKSQ
jgi:hypothetical protein